MPPFTSLTYLIDVDGTVADFANHLFKWIGAPYTLAHCKEWDLFKLLDAQQKKDAKRALDHGLFWMRQPVLPGAQAKIADIVERGHKVIWLTRPWAGCWTWYGARSRWLTDNFPCVPAGNLILAGHKELVRGDRFIDDSAEHCKSWALNHPDGVAYLVDAPHNRFENDMPSNVLRMAGW